MRAREGALTDESREAEEAWQQEMKCPGHRPRSLDRGKVGIRIRNMGQTHQDGQMARTFDRVSIG